MHLINWNRICNPRNEKGLGFKKFSLMNQAMLAKQFWRIHHNPNSLVAKTFIAKYFPGSSIHECIPKPHQSWFWRNIIKHENQKLRAGRWWGNGSKIPLSHPAWYSSQNLNNPNLTTGTVANLIDQNTHSWKPDLVKTLYPAPVCNEILSIPLSITWVVSNQLIWKFSSSGDYNVHQAYQVLLQDAKQHLPANHLPFSPSPDVWNTIWKVNVPLKNCNCIWRLLHDSLPTFLTLKRRGIVNVVCALFVILMKNHPLISFLIALSLGLAGMDPNQLYSPLKLVLFLSSSGLIEQYLIITDWRREI